MTETSNQTREVQIASLGMRALAAFSDFVILGLVAVGYGLLFGKTAAEGYGFSVDGTPAGILYVIFFAYFIVSEALWSATPAKRLFDMRVVREDDGANIGWSESVIRNILRVVDILPVLYLVGFFFAVSSPKTQRLGDRIARTVVIRV
jgi:uncharacterized RDD family membrane protein YckC